VIIQTYKETFVVGDHLTPDKMHNALYKLGTKKATALFGLRAQHSKDDFSALAERVIYPFEADAWAGKEYAFGETRVKQTWGMFFTKDKTVYFKEGYGGRGNKSVSYCFYFKNKKVCVGAGGTFVLIGDEIIIGKQNKSICQKI